MTAIEPLPRAFYQRHPAEVGPDLVGKILVRELEGVQLAGRIVEVEAYSWDDPASHSFRGPTERNKAMFGEPGHAYIYFIHGLHYCVNVTARFQAPAGGVLIRALEPLQGVEIMRRRRGRQALEDLTSGPAKLTQALGIGNQLYGSDMTEVGPLFIGEKVVDEKAMGGQAEPAVAGTAIVATPRIGISRATDMLWRFVLADSPFDSRRAVTRLHR